MSRRPNYKKIFELLLIVAHSLATFNSIHFKLAIIIFVSIGPTLMYTVNFYTRRDQFIIRINSSSFQVSRYS